MDLTAQTRLEQSHHRLAADLPARLFVEIAGRTPASDLRSCRAKRVLHVRPKRTAGDLSSGSERVMTFEKSLDQKLANIHADPFGAKDFILADAKDADMAAGLAAPGKDARTGKIRSLAEYRDQMREITRQGLVDIMLMSCSTSDQLTIQERLFDHSAVTPACRANDTTDIHLQAGGIYPKEPSRPFRSATIEQIQSGRVDPSA